MSKLTDLTAAQWRRLHRLRGEWLAAGTCSEPADRVAAEAAIGRMYELTGNPPPRFVWADSPATAVLAREWLLSSKSGAGLWEGLDDGLVAGLLDSVDASLAGLGAEARADPRTEADHALRSCLRRTLWLSLSSGARREMFGLSGLSNGLWLDIHRLMGGLTMLTRLREGLEAGLGDSLELNTYFLGQHDAYWVGPHDVLRRMGLITFRPDEATWFELWAQTARSCGWWWPHRDVCIVAERPSAVRTEEWDVARGAVRLHCADGPAMTFRDGWSVYAWHGRRVPAWVIDDPTVERIAGEANVELRRCAIELLGWERFIAEARLDPVGQPQDDPGNPGQRLYLYDVPERLWGSHIRVLLCTNGSAERDGTRRRYALTVPATAGTTPIAAAAWTARLAPHQYAQMVRRT